MIRGQLFYEFHLGLVRKIDAALDLSWRGELAPNYSPIGRSSIDPELMIRMLIVDMSLRSARNG
jgi:hypothetical protein